MNQYLLLNYDYYLRSERIPQKPQAGQKSLSKEFFGVIPGTGGEPKHPKEERVWSLVLM